MKNHDEDVLKVPEEFAFPFTPYSIQKEFMENLYSVIENKKLGIFESPTGTGKSLSIICGAIRWLKDHNELVRNQLNKRIQNLENDKESLPSDDWLITQAKEIEIARQLNALKLEQNRIIQYDTNIEKIMKLKFDKKSNKLKNWSKPKEKEGNVKEAEEQSQQVEEEEILLEESEEQLDRSDEEDDDIENKHQPVKIYICSRTHSQLAQFVGEISKSPFASNIRVASLASRQNYCINPNVSKLKAMSLINEKCLDMQKQKATSKSKDKDGRTTKKQKNTTSNCKCEFYKQENIDDLKNYALAEIQDIEDLVASGKELKACPYYASRRAAEDAEVILIPYNTLLHRATREANGVVLKNNIVIIDEAHNLLEALAQMHSAEVSLLNLEEALLQLKSYKERFKKRFSAFNLLSINQLIFVMNKLKLFLENDKISEDIFTIEHFVLTVEIDNYNMFKLIKFCKDSRIAQKIRGYAMKYPTLENPEVKAPRKSLKDFLSNIATTKTKTKQIEEESKPEIKVKTLSTNSHILPVVSLLETLTYLYKDGRILVHRNSDKSESKFKFLLLNPSSQFSDIVKEARSVIVAGGTMKPNSEFRDRLFLNAGASPERIIEFSCDHIIPPENILPIILTKGSNHEKLLFNYENRNSMGKSVKNIIMQCCQKIKGGIVVFFPSYSYENWIWEQIKEAKFNRAVFREPQNSGAVDGVLQKYADAILKSGSNGALLFSVVGGKLSEGLNFSDDLGRCVIVVGMPYANIKAPDLKEKMSYLDRTEGSGAGQKFYENQCMKAVNQCIGRACRHRDDFATVLLLDERYNRAMIKNALPAWVKRSLKVCDYDEAFKLIEIFDRNRRK